MKRKFKRAPRTSAAPTGPDPQLIEIWEQGCNGVSTPDGAEGRETPRAPIVRADGSVVPQLSFEDGVKWLAAYRAARSGLFVC
jgi:hypothetical protein